MSPKDLKLNCSISAILIFIAIRLKFINVYTCKLSWLILPKDFVPCKSIALRMLSPRAILSRQIADAMGCTGFHLLKRLFDILLVAFKQDLVSSILSIGQNEWRFK